jgi:hypothetical protein
MIDCITEYGQWRTKTKRGRLVKTASYELSSKYSVFRGRTFTHLVWVNDRYLVYCGDIKFYYPDGRYSGIRLKSLKQSTF